MEPLNLRRKEESAAEIPAEDLIEKSSSWKKIKDYIWEIIKIVIISLIIIVPIRLYVVQPFIVEGDSMAPNFHDGEYLIVDEISYRFRAPQRGEVVIFHPPQGPKTYYIKRIIGLPGETIELKDGHIYIYNNQFQEGVRLAEANYLTQSKISEISKVTLKNDEYYVIGDNRNNSLDSRRFGPLKFSHLKGRAVLRAFPFASFSLLKTPAYFFRN